MKSFHQSASSAEPAMSREFSDSTYLLQVIAHLRRVRNQKALSRKDVAARAGVRESVIRGAEDHGISPDTRNFKAWSAALGVPWNRVWRDSLMSAGRRESGHSAPAIQNRHQYGYLREE